jgi:adenylate cyclase class 2
MTDRLITHVEREIKLWFPSPVDARTAILATGAALVRPRRLQDDRLLDREDGSLRRARSTLRVRSESVGDSLTFKGPSQTSRMKVREEIETPVGRADVMLELLTRLGYAVWFRYQKYREEYARDSVVLALDETPMGTFLEIEGSEHAIEAMTRDLGRTPADYVVASYHALYLGHCDARGQTAGDMLFETDQ